MKLGINTDSLGHLPLADAAAVCEKLGLELIELGCGNWSPAPHVDLDALIADAGKRQELVDTLSAHGLSLSVLTCSGNPLAPGEKGVKDREVVEKTFILAEQLGIKTIVMMSGLPAGCPGDMTPTWITTSWPLEVLDILRYQWDVAIAQWKIIAEQAKSHGIERIALEFHGWQLVNSVETLRRLRDAIGDIIGVNMDPSHLFWMGGDPLAMIDALSDCIYHVHIKDVRMEAPVGINTVLDTKTIQEFDTRSWNFVIPGHGHDEAWWRQFILALRKAGYDGPINIEHEDCTIPLMEGLEKTVDLLNKVIV